MASPISNDNAGCSGEAISNQLQSRDLPSRRLLGKGLAGFGYETTWNGTRFARKDFVGVPSNVFVQEAAVLVGLQYHRNVVKTHGWTVDKRSCSLVLDYMEDDLLSLLQKKVESKQDLTIIGSIHQYSTSTSTQPFDMPEALDIILQLATGMEYLHNQGITHGDLKTKNILVTHKKDTNQNFTITVKVADFGLVRTKRKSKYIVSRQVRKLNFVKWNAPEYLRIIFKRLKMSNFRDGTSSESDSNSESEETSTTPVVRVDFLSADVYSFAVTCSQILTGKEPYPNLDWEDLGAEILSGLRPSLQDECPLMISNLLTSCWAPEPAQRPTFSEIRKGLEHCDELLRTGADKKRGATSYSTLDEHPIQPTDEHPTLTDIEHPIQPTGEHPTRTEIEHRIMSTVARQPTRADDEHPGLPFQAGDDSDSAPIQTRTSLSGMASFTYQPSKKPAWASPLLTILSKLFMKPKLHIFMFHAGGKIFRSPSLTH